MDGDARIRKIDIPSPSGTRLRLIFDDIKNTVHLQVILSANGIGKESACTLPPTSPDFFFSHLLRVENPKISASSTHQA